MNKKLIVLGILMSMLMVMSTVGVSAMSFAYPAELSTMPGEEGDYGHYGVTNKACNLEQNLNKQDICATGSCGSTGHPNVDMTVVTYERSDGFFPSGSLNIMADTSLDTAIGSTCSTPVSIGSAEYWILAKIEDATTGLGAPVTIDNWDFAYYANANTKAAQVWVNGDGSAHWPVNPATDNLIVDILGSSNYAEGIGIVGGFDLACRVGGSPTSTQCALDVNYDATQLVHLWEPTNPDWPDTFVTFANVYYHDSRESRDGFGTANIVSDGSTVTIDFEGTVDDPSVWNSGQMPHAIKFNPILIRALQFDFDPALEIEGAMFDIKENVDGNFLVKGYSREANTHPLADHYLLTHGWISDVELASLFSSEWGNEIDYYFDYGLADVGIGSPSDPRVNTHVFIEDARFTVQYTPGTGFTAKNVLFKTLAYGPLLDNTWLPGDQAAWSNSKGMIGFPTVSPMLVNGMEVIVTGGDVNVISKVGNKVKATITTTRDYVRIPQDSSNFWTDEFIFSGPVVMIGTDDNKKGISFNWIDETGPDLEVEVTLTYAPQSTALTHGICTKFAPYVFENSEWTVIDHSSGITPLVTNFVLTPGTDYFDTMQQAPGAVDEFITYRVTAQLPTDPVLGTGPVLPDWAPFIEPAFPGSFRNPGDDGEIIWWPCLEQYHWEEGCWKITNSCPC